MLHIVQSFYRSVGLRDPASAAKALQNLPFIPCALEALAPFTDAYQATIIDPHKAAVWPDLMRKGWTAIAEESDATLVQSAMAEVVTGMSSINLRDIATLIRASDRIPYFQSGSEVLAMVRATLAGVSPRNGTTLEHSSLTPVNPTATVGDKLPTQHIRVLIVDDDQEIITAVAETIREFGGVIAHAARTKKEINALLAGTVDVSEIDVAFIDYCLDNSFPYTGSHTRPCGTDVITQLRQRGMTCPIYLSTSSWRHDSIRYMARRVGATDTLGKIIRGEMSPADIKRVLGLPKED